MENITANLSNDKLNTVFPFYFVFDRNLMVTEAGSSIKKIFPDFTQKSCKDLFKIKRPFSVSYEFGSIIEYSNQIFILESIDKKILFKGQIVYLNQIDSAIFIGSPWLANVEEMEDKKILITDFALFDTTPDLLQIIKSQEIVTSDVKSLLNELNIRKKDLEESENRLKLQYSISQVLANTPSQQAAIIKVLEVICNNIGWKCGSFWMPSKNGEYLQNVAFWHKPNLDIASFENITKSLTFKFGEGLPGRIWKSKNWLWINDVTNDHNFPRAKNAVKANLFVAFGLPIILDGNILGIIEFFNDQILEQNDTLIQLFETSANQLAQYIEKVKANAILQESELRYKLLVEEASDIIYRTNFDGYFVYVNPVASRILKMSQNETIGKHFTELVKPEYREKVIEFYIEQIKNKNSFSYLEFPINNHKNEEYWLGQNVKMIIEDGRITGFNAVARDITERKKFEKELLLAKETAENSKQIKEQFLANMSHEIRTPMNAIIGISEILQENNLNSEQKECVDAIKLSADNLMVIINDILDFSKIESGKIQLENLPFNFEKLITGIVQTLYFTADKKNLLLNYYISSDIPHFLIGDETRIRQILINLASNAIKFTDQGFVKINCTLKDIKDENYTILFEVIDSGIGISKDNINNIFESFTQASNTTTRKFGGTGLGLTISKQLVEILGGNISVESEENKGSRFYFELTLKKGIGEKSQAIEKEILITDLKGMKILMAEDNLMNQLLAKKIFINWNCELEIADNGKIAIEMFEKNHYDLILMDIQMPEMDGYETTKFIRNQLTAPKSQIPIIAITAHALIGEAEKCINLGMNDYISKPFNKTALFKKIINTRNHIDFDVKTIQKEKYTDLTYLNELADGSDEFLNEMIQEFLNQTAPMLVESNRFLNEKNWIELGKLIHKIKPSIDFMGIKNIKNEVLKIEEICRLQNELELLPHLIEKFTLTMNSAVQELKKEFTL